jgi:gentisate 1,2-dioxygenase
MEATAHSELTKLSLDLKVLNAKPLWERTTRMGPGSPAVPTIWRYRDMRPRLLRASELITAKEAERRVFMLENPGLPGTGYITNSLYCGLQVIKPGEIAPAHRHSPNALRFIIEGEGAYSTVDGERVCAVERRRFPVGVSPTRQPLQPEATGAVMEVTKWLKPLVSVSRYTVTARVCRP